MAAGAGQHSESEARPWSVHILPIYNLTCVGHQVSQCNQQPGKLQMSMKWHELHRFWLIVTWTLIAGNVCNVHVLAESVNQNKYVGTVYCAYIDSFSVDLESIKSLSLFQEQFRFVTL